MRRIAFGLLLGVVASCGWPAVAETADPIRPITDAETVLAVYGEDWGWMSDGKVKLILAIWHDGHAVWSEDPIGGGPPYRSGQVSPDRVRELLARIEADGYFDNRALTHPHFGPDSSFTTILIHSGKGQVKMSSSHELFELGGKTIVTTGFRGLGGRRRLDVLAGDSSDDLFYRMAWAELRARISWTLPSTSAPVEGEVMMEAGRITWCERDSGPLVGGDEAAPRK